MAEVTTTPEGKHVLQWLYDQEINAKIEWLWDSGFDVAIGDALNGWQAKTNVRTWAEVEAWLRVTVEELYPER
jgi:hypothetical protein